MKDKNNLFLEKVSEEEYNLDWNRFFKNIDNENSDLSELLFFVTEYKRVFKKEEYNQWLPFLIDNKSSLFYHIQSPDHKEYFTLNFVLKIFTPKANTQRLEELLGLLITSLAKLFEKSESFGKIYKGSLKKSDELVIRRQKMLLALLFSINNKELHKQKLFNASFNLILLLETIRLNKKSKKIFYKDVNPFFAEKIIEQLDKINYQLTKNRTTILKQSNKRLQDTEKVKRNLKSEIFSNKKSSEKIY